MFKTKITPLFLMFLTAGMAFGQTENPLPQPKSDDTKKIIDQKDVEIHNLKEELEYIKKELSNLQQTNEALRDSLREKHDTLEIKTDRDLKENPNLQIFHQTIEDDHRLSQDIINEIQGLPASAAAPTLPSEIPDDTEFRTQYNAALNQYFDGNISTSLNNFRLLVGQQQAHPLSDNCQYWLGECLYSQEKYHEAIDAFRKVQNLGDGNKADAALFKIGLSYLKLNRKNDARAAFNELEKNYPQSELVAKSRQYNLSQDKF